MPDPGRTTIKQPKGNLTGLKPNQVKKLERLYRRSISLEEVVSLELARELAEISLEIRRQIGILVSRIGEVAYVVVGDESGLLIPALADYPLGKRLLRGLRLVHTHLKGEPLSDDDLTDLSLLRLDLVAVLQLTQSPERFSIQTAALVPPKANALPYQVEPSLPFTRYELNFRLFIEGLEDNLEQGLKEGSAVATGEERGILISVTKNLIEEALDSMEELKELARTAGVGVLHTVIQRPKQLNPRYLLGEGKIREVLIKALQFGATMLVFDQELSTAQIRNISELTEMKVIDRSQLILDIFAGRATTQDGKVQVELAQMKYLLPRLTGRGVQMSRLMGGIGGRGPGETKLEIDRRLIRDRIVRLERELKELSSGRYQRRQKRVKAGIPIISIVGYTNAGKSTLLNTLTKSAVFTEDLLFATLDTSSRRLRITMEREVIITDTVGFIRSLPKSLMGAFKATLEELQDADLLIHLVDCAHPRFEEQINEVDAILAELELADKPRLLVFNKVDLLPALESDPIAFLKVHQLTRRLSAISISAKERKSLGPLMKELQRRFWYDAADNNPQELDTNREE
jgi:GTP-binding protein HflX